MTSTTLRLALLVSCVSATPALAKRLGIVQESGKQGSTCTRCHGGGAVPTVELTGPAELAAGETGSFTLTITGGAASVGGFNVATDRSTANLIAGPGQKKVGAELTHASPQAFSSGSLAFTFELLAPPEGGGDVTIFGAGNSANGNNASTGDESAADQFLVRILDAMPDAGQPMDAGTPDETDAGSETDAGNAGEEDAGTEEPGTGTGTGGGTDAGEGSDSEVPQGGCGAAGLALAPIAFLGWALYLRRRRQE